MTGTHSAVAHPQPDELDEDHTGKYEECCVWWDFAIKEDPLIREVERWENIPTPTARELESREAGLARARNALAEFRKVESERIVGTSRNRAHAGAAGTDKGADAELASLFEPVSTSVLAQMFPAKEGQWGRWAQHAKANGLIVARAGHGRYNPYIAAQWWFAHHVPPGWDLPRLFRILARHLPTRSRHMAEHFAR